MIAKTIQINTALKILNVSQGYISDDGAAAISDSVKNNKSLQELYLGRNNITHQEQ